MYEHNRKERASKSNAPMVVFLTACVLVMVIVIGLFIWSWYYQLSYRDYIADFSDSTYYAYRRQTLMVEQDGKSYSILKENIMAFYSAITSRGSGRLRAVPKEEPDAALTFGDGARIELWEDAVRTNGEEKAGLIISFVNKAGERYTYDSARLSLDILPIDKEENIPTLNKVPKWPDE